MARVVAESLGVPTRNIEVVPPAVRALKNSYVPSEALGSMRDSKPGVRVLYVGNESKYKNGEVLLKARPASGTAAKGREIFLTWPKDNKAGQENGITCLGYLQGSQLAEAYHLADVFVMPSLQETVGLPMLEAMNAGVPVIAADRPYARSLRQRRFVFRSV